MSYTTWLFFVGLTLGIPIGMLLGMIMPTILVRNAILLFAEKLDEVLAAQKTQAATILELKTTIGRIEAKELLRAPESIGRSTDRGITDQHGPRVRPPDDRGNAR